MLQKLTNKLHKHFPTYGEKNILLFYIVTIFQNSWFQLGNWLLFVLLFMGEREFAVYESIAFGIGMLIEIPSGAFADLFGKKRTVVIGMFLLMLGSIIFTLGYMGNSYIFFGNIIMISAFAFISGSLEALVYDTLVEKNKVQHYDNIIGKAHSLDILSMVVASAIGGLMWKYSIYAPWILTSVAFFIALLVSLKFTEPKVDTYKFTVGNFIAQNKAGFHYLFKSKFRKYTLSFVMITGSYFMWSAGIIRILMGRDFGYNGETLNYLISGVLILSFFSAYFFKQIRAKLGDRKGFGALLLIASIAWAMSAFYGNSLYLGALVFLAITISGSLSQIWTSVILNSHVHSKDRATAISTLSFLVQIPYVLVVILFGNMIADGSASVFYLIAGVLLFVGFISFVIAEKPSSNSKVA